MSKYKTAVGVVLALGCVAMVPAARRARIHIQLTRAPGSNNSDNTGPNTGGSSGTTGDTLNPSSGRSTGSGNMNGGSSRNGGASARERERFRNAERAGVTVSSAGR